MSPAPMSPFQPWHIEGDEGGKSGGSCPIGFLHCDACIPTGDSMERVEEPKKLREFINS